MSAGLVAGVNDGSGSVSESAPAKMEAPPRVSSGTHRSLRTIKSAD